MSFYERLRNNAPEITDTVMARAYVRALTVVARGLPEILEREQLYNFIANYKQRVTQTQQKQEAVPPAFEEVLPSDIS